MVRGRPAYQADRHRRAPPEAFKVREDMLPDHVCCRQEAGSARAIPAWPAHEPNASVHIMWSWPKLSAPNPKDLRVRNLITIFKGLHDTLCRNAGAR